MNTNQNTILRSLVLAAALACGAGAVGCAQARYAETAVGGAIDNPVTVSAAWGEVYCGRGTVCAELEVSRVDTEPRDMGRVDVTLHNRTGDPVAAQIAIEIFNGEGVVVDRSNFEDIGVEARQDRTFTMPGIFRPEHKVRVVLRQRSST